LAGKKMEMYLRDRSYDSAASIETGYGLYDHAVRVQVPVGSRIVSTASILAKRSTHSPIQ
jgi:hypothetical protein